MMAEACLARPSDSPQIRCRDLFTGTGIGDIVLIVDKSLCGDALHLLDGYYAALSTFHKEKERLETLQPGEPEWVDSTEATEAAYVRLAVARRDYWGHVECHGCRQTGDLTAYLIGQLALAS